MAYFDYSIMLKRIRRWWLRRQIRVNPKGVNTTQEEAQKLFENAIFDPAWAYSNFCLLYITMVIFQPILPMGGLTGLVALILTYFAYKKMLLRDSKRPVMISKDIPLITLYMLNMTPLCYGVKSHYQISSAIFDQILTQSVTKYSWSIMLIGIIFGLHASVPGDL